MGVEECYFPMFVSSKGLEIERNHVEGFKDEVAWVTKKGEIQNKKLFGEFLFFGQE